MAATRWAYVKSYELPDPILPNTYMVVRLDGQSFHKFSDAHGFTKPNDIRALELMDRASSKVMESFPDIVLAFGESDEYSFLLQKSCSLFNRRQSKILTSITSLFTSSYVFYWTEFFPTTPLQYPPAFDGRIVVYPSGQEVKDYFAWRQADTHINNLYNTTFWTLIQKGGLTTTEAHARLRGTVSSQKNEILFSQFNINYNDMDARFRKGSVLVWNSLKSAPESHETTLGQYLNDDSASQQPSSPGIEGSDLLSEGSAKGLTEDPQNLVLQNKNQRGMSKRAQKKQAKRDRVIATLHCDVIKDAFWLERNEILG
ncbi:tRNA-His guanylyltransferase [Tulasnella sp. 419]|nr:tRNA-His guanylyltransferase [Tulasnella sp. 418]KAG8957745.1 tRNA-His guanylyltransferase [Tulasnella sp. 419]